ncbi:AAA family ATPase [Serinicoccus hydrothermalis]|uniref:AAA family ATPase n=1 Tax=Serinicoccus hydrothermalis TaxID=1758689 RepID=UPI0009F41DA8|nr:AAA family ATPase [Serinicoccus hydrothermalis]
MTEQTVARPAEFASVYVERVTTRNFRGITECTVELEPDLTLLVGRNNVGKSRILSALQLAFGGRPADVDDFTVGDTSEPEIDVFVAPGPPSSEADEDAFDEAFGRRFAGFSQTTQEEPFRERVAWRTHVRRSSEGTGARSEAVFLTFNAVSGIWIEQGRPFPLSRDHRQAFAVDLVNTGRDLMEELGRRGSSIRKVLSDLEMVEADRDSLELQLTTLGHDIVTGSRTLSSIAGSLRQLNRLIGSMGAPELNALPLRLEELARSISIDLNSGNGAMPIRLHGAGSRSLASLQVQGVLYERRLGTDGPPVRPHPLTLIEEPEAHLHPQASLELAGLLSNLRGQKVLSTHSPQLVTAVDPRCIRILPGGKPELRVIDLGPAESDAAATHRAFRPSAHRAEMEKLRRLVERPFGELLFANALVIGDGASERAFLPVVLRHALNEKAHGICVIDPESMNGTLAHAAVKFANMIGMPWFLFADSDIEGQRAVKGLLAAHGASDVTKVVWAMGVDGSGDPIEGAFEEMLTVFDRELCRRACMDIGVVVADSDSVLHAMKELKGNGGTAFASRLIEEYPSVSNWPSSLQTLISRLGAVL